MLVHHTAGYFMVSGMLSFDGTIHTKAWEPFPHEGAFAVGNRWTTARKAAENPIVLMFLMLIFKLRCYLLCHLCRSCTGGPDSSPSKGCLPAGEKAFCLCM